MTDETIVPPCHNCVCIPMCRFKRYHDLYFQCILLRDYLSWYLHNMNDDDYRSSPFLLVHDILKPTWWNVTSGGNVDALKEER